MVSRVIVIGNVLLDTEALTLLTSSGVPITFMDHGGKVLGLALAYAVAQDCLRERQQALADDPESIAAIKTWMEAVLRNGRLEMIKLLAPELAREFESLGFRNSDYCSIVKTFCPQAESQVRVVADLLTGLLHESALERINGLALDPHAGILHRRDNFGLCRDFVYMLGAELDWQIIRFFQSKRTYGDFFQRRGISTVLTGRGNYLAIQSFESRRGYIENTMGILFERYFRFVRGIEPKPLFYFEL